MASDLINRNQLLAEIYTEWLLTTPDKIIFINGEMQRSERGKILEEVMKIVQNQPTVDAVEVVHGEWTGMIPEDFACAEGFGTRMTEEQKIKYLEDFYHRTHCSVCNCCFNDRDVKNWNYCPNCGSKMDGGRKDEM